VVIRMEVLFMEISPLQSGRSIRLTGALCIGRLGRAMFCVWFRRVLFLWG